ncbi:TatD family hydrolase [Klebsiella pneumoniae]|nr:TatD family hydrolase [Klebsiella pneumoniae]
MTHRFIDTHCHFDFPPFAADEVASLARAAQAGVGRIIVPAISAERFSRVLALAAQHEALYAALGMHPIVIEEHTDEGLAQLEALMAQRPPKLVAVGEIGLDLYRDDPQFDRQQALLEAQLRLAKRYDLPVILHSRRTHDKLAMLLKKHALPRPPESSMALPAACSRPSASFSLAIRSALAPYLSRASKTREVMARLPLSALLLETDAPDMPLNGFQGQPNRPEQAARVFEALCELRPESPAAIEEGIMHNTLALFSLPPASVW